jgi:Type II secretion system (T2SS), protein N
VRALRGYLLLGLGVFVLIIGATLPASLLLPLLPARLALSDVSGTVWDGEAAGLTLDGVPLGALTWHLSPVGLLQARLAGDLTLSRADGQLTGHVSLQRGGVWTAESVRLDLPLDALHPQSGDAAWQGRLRGTVTSARLQDGWPVALTGAFTLEHLHAPHAPDDLGRYELRFDPRDQTPEALLGRLHDEGGPLAVTAQLRLNPSRTYAVSGDVGVRGAVSEELGRALAFLGTPAVDGRRPLALGGSF